MELKIKVDGSVDPNGITSKLDAELSKAKKVDEFREANKLDRIDYQDSTLAYVSVATKKAPKPDEDKKPEDTKKPAKK